MSTQAHQHSEDSERRRRLLTIAIASVSSAVAALVVSRVWGPGTIIGAAATPIIVTLVGDALLRPAEKIRVVSVTATGTRVRQGAVPLEPREGTASSGSVALTEPGGRARRRGRLIALATGLVAFVIGVGLLTSSELLFGESSVVGEKRTTVFGGSSSDSQQQEEGQETDPRTPETSTPTVTQTTTTTTPAPAPPDTTQTAPTEPVPPTAVPEPAAPPTSGTTGP
ncbi:MAG: hypothetical protein H0V81_12975 [Solirubrobacterales bacterium]|nr:hypothetical protein [Solirubrobacterales bacterium]